MDTNRKRVVVVALCAFLACCGGGGDGGPTGPNPDPDPDPDPDPTLELKGDSIFGIDLANRLFLIGSESPGVMTRLRPIQGLPPSHRIVGADFRPSDGKLYGVGTDSRVYVLDTNTAVATPVGQAPFQPAILVGFDVHFGMTIDPVTQRIRLISAESGLNWSIDPDDGTAVTGSKPRYSAGDPNEGVTPHISGLAFGPALDVAASAGLRLAAVSRMPDCDDLLYGIDPDLGWIVGTCDPDSADYVSLIDLAEFGQASSTRCAELEVLSIDLEPVRLVMPVLTFFGGRSHVDEYEIHSDGTIVRNEVGTIELDSPAQDMVWCSPKCGSSDDR